MKTYVVHVAVKIDAESQRDAAADALTLINSALEARFPSPTGALGGWHPIGLGRLLKTIGARSVTTSRSYVS